MRRLKRLLGFEEPQETKFFLVVAAWGFFTAAIYWPLSEEPAGEALLLALGLASGLIALRLILLRRAASARPRPVADLDLSMERPDESAPGTGGVDRPFASTSGLIPDETLAPFAVGLGLALILTGAVFGLAPVAVGVLPLAYGAWAWGRAARDEFDTRADLEASGVDLNDAEGDEGPSGGEAALARAARADDEGHHVVVVGGGFGGLYCGRALDARGLRVTLIDARNFHLFQPLLYQVATGAISASDIASSLRSIFARQSHVTVLLGEVVAVHPDRHCVELADGATLGYDSLVVATGSVTAYYGHEEWGPIAPGLKTVEEAEEIRRRILGAFELAERENDPVQRTSLLTFVIVGGGPTGVELAGAIGEIANVSFRRRFRRIDPAETRIILIHAADRVLGDFPPNLSRKAEQDLAGFGVEVVTRTRVTDVGAWGVETKGPDGLALIQASTVLWAAGVRASDLGEQLAAATGAALDGGGRVVVEPDFTLPGHPEISVIGDLAAAFDPVDGRRLPGVAPTAMQAGAYVAAAIRDRLDGRPVQVFRYRDKGNLATIGTGKAVAHLGRFTFSGRFAWLLWLFVHVLYLVEYQNRLLVLIQWAWGFVTRGRSALIITGRSLRPTGPPGRRA